MKAADVLRELAADAVPIFADRARCSFVNRVSRYSSNRAVPRFSVLTNDDQPHSRHLLRCPGGLPCPLLSTGEEPPRVTRMLVDDGRGAPPSI
jgi:hypothetical protein